MITLTETESERPICQYCEKAITNILAKKISSSLGVRFIYFCSSCKKVLGISHRKGFWMG